MNGAVPLRIDVLMSCTGTNFISFIYPVVMTYVVPVNVQWREVKKEGEGFAYSVVVFAVGLFIL